MAIDGMNHFTVLTKDLDATRNFYVGILGLKEGYRPSLGFPGTWLYAGAQPVLHVVAGRPLPEPPAGVLDHMAFSASDLPAIAAKLKSSGINYDLRKQPDSGVWQLFCFDPNGARVELDFAPNEAAPTCPLPDPENDTPLGPTSHDHRAGTSTSRDPSGMPTPPA